ncbi:hypothetical protein KR044_002333, partial [Drosophila immigrans]
RMNWHRFDCENLSTVLRNLTCRIGPEDMERLTSRLELLEPIVDVWCRFKVMVQRPMQNSEMVLFEDSFDVCQYLKDRRLSNKLAQYVFKNIIRDSNLPKKCPFKKVCVVEYSKSINMLIFQGLLYFHNISTLDHFPAFLPEMDFTVVIALFIPNTTNELQLTLKGNLLE